MLMNLFVLQSFMQQYCDGDDDSDDEVNEESCCTCLSSHEVCSIAFKKKLELIIFTCTLLFPSKIIFPDFLCILFYRMMMKMMIPSPTKGFG